MKIQRIVILLVVLALVVGLEVVMMSRCTRGDTAAVPTASPVPTDVPAQGQGQAQGQDPAAAQPTAPGFTSPPGGAGRIPTQPPATQAPATQPPAPTQAPTEPPAPTQAPTEPPAGSVGSTLSSGSFSSNTGTGLNMSVSWSATNLGDGKARINITGTVNSYGLDVTSLPVSISFGDYSTSVTGKSISVSGDSLTSNTLFTTSIDVDAGSSGTMTVTWQYNGEYSGTALGDISASDYVYT